jgi:hypothetical protein
VFVEGGDALTKFRNRECRRTRIRDHVNAESSSSGRASHKGSKELSPEFGLAAVTKLML